MKTITKNCCGSFRPSSCHDNADRIAYEIYQRFDRDGAYQEQKLVEDDDLKADLTRYVRQGLSRLEIFGLCEPRLQYLCPEPDSHA